MNNNIIDFLFTLVIIYFYTVFITYNLQNHMLINKNDIDIKYIDISIFSILCTIIIFIIQNI